jgi:hypothetical protein
MLNKVHKVLKRFALFIYDYQDPNGLSPDQVQVEIEGMILEEYEILEILEASCFMPNFFKQYSIAETKEVREALSRLAHEIREKQKEKMDGEKW